MRPYYEIIGACWIAFFAAWAILAMVFGTGGSRYSSPGSIGIRLLIFILFIIGLRFGIHAPMRQFGGHAGGTDMKTMLPQIFGVYTADVATAGALLCIAGLTFATWARVVLGRNWGMPMTVHEDPELITSGPYHYVRHPIYTGLIAMWFGTMMVFPIAAVPGVAIIAYSLVSAVKEERDMEQRFPETYPEYRKHSKMLIPFLI